MTGNCPSMASSFVLQIITGGRAEVCLVRRAFASPELIVGDLGFCIYRRLQKDGPVEKQNHGWRFKVKGMYSKDGSELSATNQKAGPERKRYHA